MKLEDLEEIALKVEHGMRVTDDEMYDMFGYIASLSLEIQLWKLAAVASMVFNIALVLVHWWMS